MGLNSAQISGDFHSEVNGEATLAATGLISGPLPAEQSPPPGLSPQGRLDYWIGPVLRLAAEKTVCCVAIGRWLIKAKADLRKHRLKGQFTTLVEAAGWSLDRADRWMAIARKLALLDSAALRKLPPAPTTLHQILRLPPGIIKAYTDDGTIDVGLSLRDAETLVRRTLASNSNGQGHSPDEGRDGNHDAGHNVDDGARDDDRPEPAADRDVGPSSQHELERKLARLEELEREVVVRGRTIEILEHENAELTARLAPETPIRAQRRLFLQAVRALQKADAPGTLGKDARVHKQSAVTDLLELVRSAARDGLKPDRFDLIYRPELH